MAHDDPRNDVAWRALAIASVIAAADPGERAAARRMGESGCQLFWRQAARLGIAAHDQARWHTFTRLTALLTPSTVTNSIQLSTRPHPACPADGPPARATPDPATDSDPPTALAEYS